MSRIESVCADVHRVEVSKDSEGGLPRIAHASALGSRGLLPWCQGGLSLGATGLGCELCALACSDPPDRTKDTQARAYARGSAIALMHRTHGQERCDAFGPAVARQHGSL